VPSGNIISISPRFTTAARAQRQVRLAAPDGERAHPEQQPDDRQREHLPLRHEDDGSPHGPRDHRRVCVVQVVADDNDAAARRDVLAPDDLVPAAIDEGQRAHDEQHDAAIDISQHRSTPAGPPDALMIGRRARDGHRVREAAIDIVPA
jgi:hypothetical protein